MLINTKNNTKCYQYISIYIDWTSNSPGGAVNTYKTNDTNTLAVSLTYTSQ
jgi:hypothetical protein